LCIGVSTSTVTANGPQINETYAPLLPPNEAQTVIESLLSDILNKVPHTFSIGCQISIRKLFCSSAYYLPDRQVMNIISGTDLLSVVVYPPKLPHRDLCFQYHEKCEKLIKLDDRLDLNCTERQLLINGVTRQWVDRFPVKNQTVATVPGANSQIITSPNNATNAVVTATVVCPRGFAVPDNLYAEGQIMITGMN
jgi:hypothetical protein